MRARPAARGSAALGSGLKIKTGAPRFSPSTNHSFFHALLPCPLWCRPTKLKPKLGRRSGTSPLFGEQNNPKSASPPLRGDHLAREHPACLPNRGIGSKIALRLALSLIYLRKRLRKLFSRHCKKSVARTLVPPSSADSTTPTLARGKC